MFVRNVSIGFLNNPIKFVVGTLKAHQFCQLIPSFQPPKTQFNITQPMIWVIVGHKEVFFLKPNYLRSKALCHNFCLPKVITQILSICESISESNNDSIQLGMYNQYCPNSLIQPGLTCKFTIQHYIRGQFMIS